MPNPTPDASERQCGGDSESQRERQTKQNFNVGEFRSLDEWGGSESSPRGVSFANNEEEKLAGSCADERDDDGRRRREVITGSCASREHDYIGFCGVTSSSYSQAVRKSDDRVLGMLGPKTKETELRLGLPEGAENNDVSDVPGSRRRLSTEKLDACVGLSLYGVHSTHLHNSAVVSRDAIVGKGGSTHQQQQFFSGEVRALERNGFLAGVEPHGSDYSSHSREELKQKPAFQEFPARELPFDIRFSQHEKWAKPMMGMPPINSVFRMARSGLDISDNRRGFASGVKRIFSDTLDGRHSDAPQSNSPKLLNPHSKPCLPPPTFMFSLAGGPNTWQTNWESRQTETNLGNISGHMGSDSMPTLTPEVQKDCVGEASSCAVQASNQVVPGLPGVAPSVSTSNRAETEATRNETRGQSEARTARVVGWPPIRSFRKNLAAQPKVAPNAAPPPPPPPPAAPGPGPPFAPEHGGQKMTTKFVKVNVEGVAIGRKIDLKAYDSYEKLSVVLDEMFRGSIPAQKLSASSSCENNEASLLSGRDYVLVYEDDEGDRLLVADDVPWEMFVGAVKRLRILKSSEARGLATNTQHLHRAE